MRDIITLVHTITTIIIMEVTPLMVMDTNMQVTVVIMDIMEMVIIIIINITNTNPDHMAVIRVMGIT